MALFWRSSEFEVPLHTSKECLISDFERAVNLVIHGEELEIGDCAEKTNHENFVLLVRVII